jgi:hypothetical protein
MFLELRLTCASYYIMKKAIFILIAALSISQLKAQLADGSIAPDFTGTDTDGVSWHLYEQLDNGKIVLLNFFAAWDEYAWQYYLTGELQSFYQAYGPDGTGEVVVLNIEAEPSNSIQQLMGPLANTSNPATQTQGDWLTNNPIPTIDSASIADSMNVNYVPTVYMICPDRVVSELSQDNAAILEQALHGLVCPELFDGLDAAVLNGSANSLCGQSVADISFNLRNLGTLPLTSAYIVVNGIQSPFGYTWEGNLQSYFQTEILFEDVVLLPNSNVLITITSADDNTLNNHLSIPAGVVHSSWNIQVELGLDNWPQETSWEIRNENDEVIYSDGDFTIPYQYFNSTYTMPADGCYSFYLYDANGDGLHGSQWSGFDGSCYVRGYDNNGYVMSVIYSYDGSVNFSSTLGTPAFQKADFYSTYSVGVEDLSIQSALCWPNPGNGFITLNTSAFDRQNFIATVVSVDGKLVWRSNFNNGSLNQVDLSSLSEGIYMLQLTDGKTIRNEKLIIRK